MKTATKAARAEALKVILVSAVEEEVLQARNDGETLNMLSTIFMHTVCILFSKLAFYYYVIVIIDVVV